MVNNVDSTTAVSIAFLMKSVDASLNFSGSNTIAEFCEPMPDVPKEVCNLLFAEEYNAVTFWTVLMELDRDQSAGTEIQSFLISVFYDGLSPELRCHFFVSERFPTLSDLHRHAIHGCQGEQVETIDH